jgi:hypothetical protein
MFPSRLYSEIALGQSLAMDAFIANFVSTFRAGMPCNNVRLSAETFTAREPALSTQDIPKRIPIYNMKPPAAALGMKHVGVPGITSGISSFRR